MKYIPLEKDKIPYSFDVKLSDKTYTIDIRYNNYSNEFTADLILGEETLVKGKKMLMGQAIFEEFAYDNNGNKNPKFYNELLVPYDLSWQEEIITLDNLGEKAQIYVIERD